MRGWSRPPRYPLIWALLVLGLMIAVLPCWALLMIAAAAAALLIAGLRAGWRAARRGGKKPTP